jgi:hypothetical protein
MFMIDALEGFYYLVQTWYCSYGFRCDMHCLKKSDYIERASFEKKIQLQNAEETVNFQFQSGFK